MNQKIKSNVKYISSGNIPTVSQLPKGNLAFGKISSDGKYHLYGNVGSIVVDFGVGQFILSDDEKLAQDKAALTIDVLLNGNSSPNDVTSNLTLPTSGSIHGSIITWASNVPSVISNSGTVNRMSSDTAVILTATLRYNSTTTTSIFRVTVTANTVQGYKISGGIYLYYDRQHSTDIAINLMKGSNIIDYRILTVDGGYYGDEFPYEFNSVPPGQYAISVYGESYGVTVVNRDVSVDWFEVNAE